MAISATLVRDLREKTSAGMLDCKKALEETQGNFDAAVEWLRKKGLASAAKKADRLASEGVVVGALSGNSGVLLEVNSETDFVAKNDLFKSFVQEVTQIILRAKPAPENVEALSTLKLASGQSIEESLKEAISRIGENLVIRRFVRIDGHGPVQTYIHGDGKIGVVVELSGAPSEAASTLARDICLHVAAMNPLALSSEFIDAQVIAKEKEILKAKNLEQGKKPEMVDKIVEGQIRKFLAESSLLDQNFVKNPEIKIRDHIAAVGKSTGAPLELKKYIRFELGEGLQKRANNFAEEVAAQMKSH